MKKNLFVSLLALALLITLIPATGLAGAQAPGGKLVLYTSVPTTQLNMMVDMFNRQYPGIAVDVCWAQNTDLVSRILNEGGAGQGDVYLGGGPEDFLAVENRLAAYETPNAASLHTEYLSEQARFTPVQLHVSAMIVNPAAAEALGADVKGWESLKDKALSGRVLYMDPAKSSPGAQQAAFIGTVAESAGIKAPSAPSFVLNAVSAGQFAVGITSENKAIEYKLANLGLEILYAKEGVAMSASYAGLLTDAPHAENARLFIDFITSKAYQQAAADQLYLRSVRRDVDFNLQGVLPTDELRAVNYDFMTLVMSADAGIVAKK